MVGISPAGGAVQSSHLVFTDRVDESQLRADARTVIVISKAPSTCTATWIKVFLDQDSVDGEGFAGKYTLFDVPPPFVRRYDARLVLCFECANVAKRCMAALKSCDEWGPRTKFIRTDMQAFQFYVRTLEARPLRRSQALASTDARVPSTPTTPSNAATVGAARSSTGSSATASAPQATVLQLQATQTRVPQLRARSAGVVERRWRSAEVVKIWGESRLVCKNTFLQFDAIPH